MVDLDATSLLLMVAIVAMVLPVAYWVLRPLIVGTLPELPPDPKAVALLSEREAALASLRDLDADLRDGRIGEDGHADTRAVLVERAARVLEALDALSEEREGESSALAAVLEEEVLAARGITPSAALAKESRTGEDASDSSQASTSAEAPIQAPTQAPTEALALATDAERSDTRSCEHCGYRSRSDARFCGGCGAAFEESPA